MSEEGKRSRFQELRQRQADTLLTEAESAELAILVEEIEAAEARYLAPAAERLGQERKMLEAQNRSLEALAFRKTALVSRLRNFLVEAQVERRAIEGELATVLAGGRATPDG